MSNYVPHTILAPQAPWPGKAPVKARKPHWRQRLEPAQKSIADTVFDALRSGAKTSREVEAITGYTEHYIRKVASQTSTIYSEIGPTREAVYWIAARPPKLSRRSSEYQILIYVTEHSGASVKDVVKKAKLKPSTVNAVLKNLVSQGNLTWTQETTPTGHKYKAYKAYRAKA